MTCISRDLALPTDIGDNSLNPHIMEDDDYLDSDDDDNLRMFTPYVGDDIRGPPPVYEQRSLAQQVRSVFRDQPMNADPKLSNVCSPIDQQRSQAIPLMSLPQDASMEHPLSNKVVSPVDSVIDVVGGVVEDFVLPSVRSDIAEAGDEADYFTDEDMDRAMPTLNNETLQVGEEDSVYLDRASAPPSCLPDIVDPIRPLIPLRRMPSPE